MFVYHIHVYCPQRQYEGIRLLRTEDKDDCELSWRFWGLNPNLGVLQEQLMLLTTVPSP